MSASYDNKKAIFAAVVPNSAQILPQSEISVKGTQGFQLCPEILFYDENFKSITNCGSIRVPLLLFIGLKEGDYIQIEFKDPIHDEEYSKCNLKKFNAELQQLKTKWNSEGNFENALYERTLSFGGIYHDDKIIKQIHQYALTISTHLEYATKMEMPVKDPTDFRFSKEWIKICQEEMKKQPTLSYLEKFTQFGM